MFNFLIKTLVWSSCQMRKGSPAQLRWSFLEKRSMHHWKLTANRSIQSSREGKWHKFQLCSDGFYVEGEKKKKYFISSTGSPSSSSDCQRCDPLAWSAWSISFSSNWLVTRQLTRSSWKCSKRPIIWCRLETRTVVFRKLESGKWTWDWSGEVLLRFVSLSHYCLHYTSVQHRFAF